jgi:PAS domain S-box-containing protein
MIDDAKECQRLRTENEALRERLDTIECEKGSAGTQSAESWRRIVNDAPLSIATVGLDKHFLGCNREFCNFLGYSVEELCQKTISDVTHPQDQSIGIADMRAVVAGEKTTSRHEKRYVRKDSATVWGEVSINLIRNEHGQPLHFLAFILDISERKQAEDALQTEMANLDAVFESSPIGMFILDEDTNIIRANTAIVTLCGGDIEEVMQHRPGDALHCLHSTGNQRGCGHGLECPLCPARRAIEELLANGGTLRGAELPLQLFRNGEPQEVWLRIGAEPLLLNGCRHLCVALEDVTLRKQAEKDLKTLNADLEQRVRERTVELEASSKELEAFSYSVSHDLRTPLRAIDGFGLALLEEYEDKLDAEGKDYLQKIRAATQRMGTLIDDLLQLSRLTRAQMLVEKVNLTEIAWSIIHEMQQAEPERVVTIKIAPDLDDMADPKLMRIALENLLNNAWKFTAKQPESIIELGVTTEGSKKTYFVRDNGAGFDMAYMNKLFVPFQRLHSVEEYPGTGIGLGTVQRVMQRHGGAVWAEGQVDKGATFYFSFTS